MKLEVGMYVRTDDGIAKVIEKRKNPYGEETIFKIDKPFIFHFADFLKTSEDMIDVNFVEDTSQIKGASHNIIDLIEEGDYVNGTIVTTKTPNKYIELDYSCNRKGCYEEDIKTVVTKEQFEAIKYEVK